MPLDLTRTYLHLTDAAQATAVDVDPDFWSEIGERTELQEGRLLCRFPVAADWGHWERHPAGDEVLILLDGAIDVLVEGPDGVERVALEADRAFVVPRGLWHTVRVREPGTLLAITRGAGTEHRPL